MTRTELLDHLATLTPTQRRTVLSMARTIRAARDAGDTRSPEVLVAPMLAAKPGTEV